VDDSAWLRVTAIGLPDAVKADWAASPLLAPLLTQVRVAPQNLAPEEKEAVQVLWDLTPDKRPE
jgi:hypothetical protein